MFFVFLYLFYFFLFFGEDTSRDKSLLRIADIGRTDGSFVGSSSFEAGDVFWLLRLLLFMGNDKENGEEGGAVLDEQSLDLKRGESGPLGSSERADVTGRIGEV